uniref:Peptidase M14 carboxypeptidase A domain-containing protein n=1 Tax=Ditylenchus dipsaci TaxID=166011 RepID=A0A915E9X9_9BILA
MVRYMRTLDFYYPHIVQLVQIGKTHEGRSIEGIKVLPRQISDIIAFGCFRLAILQPIQPQRGFFGSMEMLIHAREWASSHTALFIINQLVSGYGKNSEITHYVNKLNFIIVPCTNPDGFEYSRSSLNPQVT